MGSAVQADRAGSEIFPPVIENGDGRAPVVLLCDHATNAEAGFGALGVSSADWQDHIAWDPGALPVARLLSQRLDAALVYPTVSRLVIDCNRALDAPGLVPAMTGGVRVAGNQAIPEPERAYRIAAIHEPYHAAIEGLAERRLGKGETPALVAIHTFTPVYGGISRPWQVGVLFNRDRRLAERCLDALTRRGDLVVGVNEPYAPTDGVYYTLGRHAEARGLPCVMIEIRNDLVRDEAGCAEWSERLAEALGGSGGG
ncbi:N-formylglutamate amidohydrolase [Faunimonas sp. B44]|uniref:N-formylglutamate amidohydrolase n=1 Tax=Faunimonas sp. B44 TaxID=3461493 RepID=UPI0040439948